MAGLLDFLNSPSGVGLLSAVAGGMTGAQRGTPWNNAGRSLASGLMGYQGAQSLDVQNKKNAVEEQFKALQLGQLQRQNEQQKAQDTWRAGLPSVMQPQLTGTTDQGTQLAAQQNAFGQDGVQSLVDASQYSSPSAPLNMSYGADPQKLNDYMMNKDSPYFDKMMEQRLIPKTPISLAEGASLIDPVTHAVLVAGKPKNDKPALLKEYEYSKEQGYNGTFTQWKNENSKAGAAKTTTPYFQFLPTGDGYVAGDARTGTISVPTVGGKRVIQSASDPKLQGNIANSKASGEVYGKTGAESAIALPQALQDAGNTIKLVDDMLKHPGFKQAVGTSSLMGIQHIPGTDAKDFNVRLDQLKGQQFMQAYQSLKGGGQITEVEGVKATNAISRMNTSSSEPEFIKASREFQAVIRQGMKRANQKAAAGGFANQQQTQQPAQPQAVDFGSLQ